MPFSRYSIFPVSTWCQPSALCIYVCGNDRRPREFGASPTHAEFNVNGSKDPRDSASFRVGSVARGIRIPTAFRSRNALRNASRNAAGTRHCPPLPPAGSAGRLTTRSFTSVRTDVSADTSNLSRFGRIDVIRTEIDFPQTRFSFCFSPPIQRTIAIERRDGFEPDSITRRVSSHRLDPLLRDNNQCYRRKSARKSPFAKERNLPALFPRKSGDLRASFSKSWITLIRERVCNLSLQNEKPNISRAVADLCPA